MKIIQVVKKSRGLPLFLLQLIAALAVLITLLVIRSLDPALFGQVRQVYDTYLCDDTDVTELTKTNKSDPSSRDDNAMTAQEEDASTAATEDQMTPETSNQVPLIETTASHAGDSEVERVQTVSDALQAVSMVVGQKVNNSLVVPVNGVLTSGFGMRSDPFTSQQKKHKGTDVAAVTGTPILSAADGTVSFVGFDRDGYGNYLKIRHGTHFETLYGHCSEVLVTVGQTVTAGQTVALVGNTGGSTGSHLHFEIRLDGIPVNPDWYVNWGT